MVTNLKSNQIKKSSLFVNLASGWYVAILSKELHEKPVELRLFGRDLVAWRGGSRQAVVMDRYCAHMGSSLGSKAGGRIVNGCIECPFHKWQFNSQGHCVEAPDVENIPKIAYQPTYHCQERYGYIWVWYGTPDPLYQLPEIVELESLKANYLPIRFKILANTTARKVLENNYDQSHLKTVHQAPILKVPIVELAATSENSSEFSHLHTLPHAARFGGTIQANMKQYIGLTGMAAKMLGLNFNVISLKMESWPTGHIISVSLDGDLKFVAYIAISPVEENLTIQRFGIQILKTKLPLKTLGHYILFGFQNYLNANQDKPIWDNMAESDDGGVFVKNDRSVLEYRKFYQRWLAEK